MQKIKSMETMMGLILTIGMFLSAVLVFLGGVIFLFQHGSENIHSHFIMSESYQTNTHHILESVLAFSPIGMIELGLLTLVATQIIRVALLVLFYGITRDYWFSFFSLFIMTVLVYSFFWSN